MNPPSTEPQVNTEAALCRIARVSSLLGYQEMKRSFYRNKNWICYCTVVAAIVMVYLMKTLTHSREQPNVAIRMMRYHDFARSRYNVTYDTRSFIINNTRTIILSGSVHYPRSTPGMWDHIFEEMVNDGLNAVEAYVFWNIHEFKRGQKYDFTGSANLPLFIEKAAKAGLFVILRIGPYVCAEWNLGGLPVWLSSIPGMRVRSDNEVWMQEMERFTSDIAILVEKYLARNGGPIIAAQVENEYHWKQFGYINWCGKLADKLDLDIPWLMCNGYNAWNTIKTCNSDDCQQHVQAQLRHYWWFRSEPPLIWTEDQGWFQSWGMEDTNWSYRTPEDMAYVMLAWFARGGCYHNYYMWYGGNNMGRSAAMGISNKYADGVNLHSDMLPNEPKKTHLAKLHKVISKISPVLLSSQTQARNPVDLHYYNTQTSRYDKLTQQMAFVYHNKAGHIVFIQNSAPVKIKVWYENQDVLMQPMSIKVFDVIQEEFFLIYDSAETNYEGLRTKRVYSPLKVKINTFVAWSESVKDIAEHAVPEQHPLEQLGITQDETDYLFYQTKVTVPVVDKAEYKLTVETRKANALLVFVNEHFEGGVDNHDVLDAGDATLTLKIKSNDQSFQLTILSVSLGITNVVKPGFVPTKGLVGKVSINGADITNQKWFHRPKLTGEMLRLYTNDGSDQVRWDSDYKKYAKVSLTWFKTTFTVEQYSNDYSLLLHLVGFGRGHFYVNGVDLGRYWLIKMVGSTKYVQEYYFIPPDVLRNGENLLVIGEELGAPDPSKATLVLSTMTV